MATTTRSKAAGSVTSREILDELRSLGSESYKRILMNHGIPEPLYGVKIEHLKKIQKRAGMTDYRLALELYDTGVYDAMYLAGLMADDAKMTRKDLRGWMKRATSAVACGTIVAGVAAGSEHGWELGREWIESAQENVAAGGWTTLGAVVSVVDDSELDMGEIRELLRRVGRSIHGEPDRVRYAMNGFVIAVGCYVKPLTDEAVAVARAMGKVSVDMGRTACKVPDAVAYIGKVRERGAIGKKRASAKC